MSDIETDSSFQPQFDILQAPTGDSSAIPDSASLSATSGYVPTRITTRNTVAGRLRPAQDLLAQILRKNFGDQKVTVVDIGVGDGAPTILTDLVESFEKFGVQADIVGIDIDHIEVPNVLLGKKLDKEAMPPGISVIFAKGDILAPIENPLSLHHILTKLSGGTGMAKPALVMSSNLVTGPPGERHYRALHSMRSIVRSDGLIAFGTGGAEAIPGATLKLKIFSPSNESTDPLIHWDLGGLGEYSIDFTPSPLRAQRNDALLSETLELLSR